MLNPWVNLEKVVGDDLKMKEPEYAHADDNTGLSLEKSGVLKPGRKDLLDSVRRARGACAIFKPRTVTPTGENIFRG